MNLQPLSVDTYRKFAIDLFDENNKTLAPDVVDIVYQRFNGVTAYMQRIMNVLFQRTNPGQICTAELIDAALNYTLGLADVSFEALLRQVPQCQRKVLIAIAHEGKVRNVTAGSFTRKYNLPSTSSVNSAVKGLLTKDLITEEKGFYQVYDQLFALWIKQYFNS